MKRRLLGLITALRLGIFGCSSAAESSAAAPEAPTPTYTYDSQYHAAATPCTTIDRGPPPFGYTTRLYLDSLDVLSRGESASSDETITGAGTPYGDPSGFSPVGRAMASFSSGADKRIAETTNGRARPVSGARVDASGATRLGETVSPLGRTYENADTYLGDVAKHYGMIRLARVLVAALGVLLGLVVALPRAAPARSGADEPHLDFASAEGTSGVDGPR